MRKNEGRTIGLYFKVTPEELTLIENKMKKAKIPNKRAYLRKMAVDGYVISIEMGNIVEMIKLLRSISNNVNQIARRCNETRNLYIQDVEELQQGYASIQKQMMGLIKRLSNLWLAWARRETSAPLFCFMGK